MKRKIKVLKDLGEYKAGETVTIEVFDNGDPKSNFWRRRLRDSSIDNCVEFVEDKKPEKKEVKKDESKGENR